MLTGSGSESTHCEQWG